jgi:uncharacterized integral membrane protein
MIKLKLIAALTLILLVLIVVFQNTEPVATRFLFVSFIMPRAALLVITFLVGAIAGLLLSFGMSTKLPKK